MEQVVDRIAQEHLEGVRIKAEFISARCPFHGVDRHPSFWVERSTGRWGCFSCSAKGSSIRWLLKELGVKNNGIENAIKEAEKDRSHASAILNLQRLQKAKSSFTGTSILPEALLGLWNNCPVALLEAGFKIEELERHDIGFDDKRKRITFPIRDIEGNLIGISGRTVTGAWPKYKVYQGYHDAVDSYGKTFRSPGELGAWFPNYSSTDIRNHLYRGNFVFHTLFNNQSDYLIVVEGYKASLWLVQMGYEHTVALMGAKMSAGQERIIRRMGVATYILLDNNDAGKTGADSIGRQLGNCSFPVYQCHYPQDASDSAQPDDLTKEAVEEMLNSATRAVGNRRGSRDAYRSWRSKI
jgi:hypothetical protein